MKSYLCVDAKCPFYKGDDGHSMVSCEGVERAVCVKISFHLTESTEEPWFEKDEFKKFFYKKCAGDYKSCPIFRMIITENYPEDTEGLKPYNLPAGDFKLIRKYQKCPKRRCELEGQINMFEKE